MSAVRVRAWAAAGGVLLALTVAACGGSGGKATPAPSPVARSGNISVSAPMVPAPASGDVAALYFTVRNDGDRADLLTAVTTDASGSAMVHETVEQGSTSVMRPLAGGLSVPAHGEVRLAPGGYHVMMTALQRRLAPGATVQVTLTFEHAGKVAFTAPVGDYGGMAMPMGTATATP